MNAYMSKYADVAAYVASILMSHSDASWKSHMTQQGQSNA